MRAVVAGLVLALLAPGLVAAADAAAISPLRADAIAAGGFETCSVAGGAARCWGLGGSGQLGGATSRSVGDDETPGTTRPISLGAGVTGISVGGSHACAIIAGGRVRCWGAGGNGRLGLGRTATIGDDELPSSQRTVDLGIGRTAVAIAAGGSHTCAILDDGSVRCWGNGEAGALGSASRSTIGDDERPGSVRPIDLGPGRTAVAIAAGGAHTCAILDDRTVRCWGDGSQGAVGSGTTATIGDDESPGFVGPVDLGAGRTAVAIAAGGAHTCALLDDGRVRCWGDGSQGALGTGSRETIGDDERPGSSRVVDLPRRATAIAAGGLHTCALLVDGSVHCWGANGAGQLGIGSTRAIGDDERPRSAPPVDLGGRATAIAAGLSHTCALLDDRTVRCWGSSSSGQLGYGAPDAVGDDERPSTMGPVDLAPRWRARQLTVEATLAPGERPPYRLRLGGRLVVPAAPQTRACDGEVVVTARLGQRTLGRATGPLARSGGRCAYAAELVVASRPKGPSAVALSATFAGNAVVLAATSRSASVPLP